MITRVVMSYIAKSPDTTYRFGQGSHEKNGNLLFGQQKANQMYKFFIQKATLQSSFSQAYKKLMLITVLKG